MLKAFTVLCKLFIVKEPCYYLLQIPDPFDRSLETERIIKECKKHSSFTVNRVQELSSLNSFIENYSLFGGAPLIVIDRELKKSEIEELEPYLIPDSDYVLIIAQEKGLEPLSKKKGVYFLDRSKEKPWEKQKRLANYFLANCAGKTISQDALKLLLEGVQDFATAHQEIQKILTYLGEGKAITKELVEEILTSSFQKNLYTLADELIWEKKPILEIDPSLLPPLFSIIRGQLLLGLQLANGEEVSSKAPKWVLEKKRLAAIKLTPDYFKKGLELLYQVELLSRSQISSPLLFSYFQGKL